jgi:F-type H+-transporting ATPase subunit delta
VPEASNVARRYAAAVLQLAEQEKALDTWRDELAKLDQLLHEDVLLAAFRNPAVGMQRRLELARLLAPELRPQTENLLRLLVEHHRTSDIHAIKEAYGRLADEAAGITHATITTAIRVDRQDEDRYRRALERRLERKVNLTFETDPAMIGGAAIKIGDHLVDGSIRTQLERLRQELLS